MKGTYWLCILVAITTIGFAELGKNVTATTHTPFALAQTSASSNQRVLEVVLPESATVRLTAGESYTGELTAFDSTQLTLSASGFSQSIPLAQIREVELQGNVWIVNPDGRRTTRRIRGLAIPLRDVPVDALELSSPPNYARLNLTTVLTDQQFERLSGDRSRIHAVVKIEPESAGRMDVTVKTVQR